MTQNETHVFLAHIVPQMFFVFGRFYERTPAWAQRRIVVFSSANAVLHFEIGVHRDNKAE
jgi:hypothetical protein